MNAEINLKADEVWEYYQTHKEECRTHMMLIASCKDFGIEIYITEENQNKLSIIIEADDTEVCREYVYSKLDCELTIRKVYGLYLTERALDALTAPTEPPENERFDDEEIKAEIEHCEKIFQNLFEDLIGDIVGGSALGNVSDLDVTDDMVSDIKEHTLEYMARKHGLPIYRPMYLEDENGEIFYTDYPYECMIFEDEDNPMYKNS